METNRLFKIFEKVDTSNYPDFHQFKRTFERALWVLWVAKESLRVKGLTAEQIALVATDILETSIMSKSITLAFNRSGDRVHRYLVNGDVYYQIMKSGKDHLRSRQDEKGVEVLYFEPGKKYSSKRLLSKDILLGLKGNIRILDPYCSGRTLDVIKDIKNKSVKILTRLANLSPNNRASFLRDFKEFKAEYSDFEFRDYAGADLHDRYIISSNNIILIGHSIKDLGAKESFAVTLKKAENRIVFDSLVENFNRRWKTSKAL